MPNSHRLLFPIDQTPWRIWDELFGSQAESYWQTRPYLFSPFVLQLPKNIEEKIKFSVSKIYQYLSDHNINKLNHLNSDYGNHGDGAFHSYDFHYDLNAENQNLYLIEVNTNAAGWAMSTQFAAGFGEFTAQAKSAEMALVNMLQHEVSFDLTAHNSEVWIMDETPNEQHLYLDFLLLKALLEKYNIQTKIISNTAITALDLSSIHNILIINRLTDFHFHKPENQLLKNMSTTIRQNIVISPNEKHWEKFANKALLANMADIAHNNSNEYAFLGETQLVTEANHAALWANKKNWFFKPLEGFGGKATYRGATITRKTWENNVIKLPYLAQKFTPAGEINTAEFGKLKFDLRAYAAQGDVKWIVARLYQGQMTNFRSIGSGFALIDWL